MRVYAASVYPFLSRSWMLEDQNVDEYKCYPSRSDVSNQVERNPEMGVTPTINRLEQKKSDIGGRGKGITAEASDEQQSGQQNGQQWTTVDNRGVRREGSSGRQ